MIKNYFFLILLLLKATFLTRAEEGLWMPLYLDSLNIQDMQDRGLRLDAADIYNTSHTGLTDAVVLFGRGCTGAVISANGLVITNHHCGLGYVQSHSTVDNDYITEGFWAATMADELPNPGLTVSFLERIEDITPCILEGVDRNMNETVRSGIIQANIMYIRDSIAADSNHTVEIKPLYYGNEYYLYIYEVFKDVRLVGVPPASIGNFGGDTDNWVWPRHTGDFSLFRIYAGKDNRPAPYAPDNVPYKPAVYLPISLKGINEGDFTMVCGYPGSTYQFLTSCELGLIAEKSVPAKIRVRTDRMNIMQQEMRADPAVRIKYASKYARITNAWKKWIGMLKGLERMNVLERKSETESKFLEWVHQDREREMLHGSLLPRFDTLCRQLDHLVIAHDYENEVIMAVELFGFISDLAAVINVPGNMRNTVPEAEDVSDRATSLMQNFFRDYYEPIDVKIFASMMKRYREDLPVEFQPEMLLSLEKKYKGDYEKMAGYIYGKTIFLQPDKLYALLTELDDQATRKLMKDPANVLYGQFMEKMMVIDYFYNRLNTDLENNYRLYVRALREMEQDKMFYPDANLTMRISYGEISGFYPVDAVQYQYYTTLQGVMEKEDPEVYDYHVPDKLKELYRQKDYGRYARNDTMHVCFIASNHTSGGNSGSPVFNADGQLIGLNFDRNWEGTMSDYLYDPSQCRNISLDVRYALFIIDKFAGAGHLIDEMTLVE